MKVLEWTTPDGGSCRANLDSMDCIEFQNGVILVTHIDGEYFLGVRDWTFFEVKEEA